MRPANLNQRALVACGPEGHAESQGVCYKEKAPNAWHRRGTSKTGNTEAPTTTPNDRQPAQTTDQGMCDYTRALHAEVVLHAKLRSAWSLGAAVVMVGWLHGIFL